MCLHRCVGAAQVEDQTRDHEWGDSAHGDKTVSVVRRERGGDYVRQSHARVEGLQVGLCAGGKLESRQEHRGAGTRTGASCRTIGINERSAQRDTRKQRRRAYEEGEHIDDVRDKDHGEVDYTCAVWQNSTRQPVGKTGGTVMGRRTVAYYQINQRAHPATRETAQLEQPVYCQRKHGEIYGKAGVILAAR